MRYLAHAKVLVESERELSLTFWLNLNTAGDVSIFFNWFVLSADNLYILRVYTLLSNETMKHHIYHYT